MNWILGLKRLWLLASLIVAAYIFNKTMTRPGFCLDDPDSPIYCGRNIAGERIFEAATMSVAVSVSMYLVGAGIIWVVRGFRQKDPQA
jgi:hypothetical protein